jgi:hypothetical protein
VVVYLHPTVRFHGVGRESLNYCYRLNFNMIEEISSPTLMLKNYLILCEVLQSAYSYTAAVIS